MLYVGRLHHGNTQSHSSISITSSLVPWPSSLAAARFAAAAAARFSAAASACFAAAAAARPSGERATHSAASSAVAKLPRLTSVLPRRFSCAM
eukprot:scaffold122119_cov60-Phaeocystis_antarctica.AAC.3